MLVRTPADFSKLYERRYDTALFFSSTSNEEDDTPAPLKKKRAFVFDDDEEEEKEEAGNAVRCSVYGNTLDEIFLKP